MNKIEKLEDRKRIAHAIVMWFHFKLKHAGAPSPGFWLDEARYREESTYGKAPSGPPKHFNCGCAGGADRSDPPPYEIHFENPEWGVRCWGCRVPFTKDDGAMLFVFYAGPLFHKAVDRRQMWYHPRCAQKMLEIREALVSGPGLDINWAVFSEYLIGE